jgi:hypothetical protein
MTSSFHSSTPIFLGMASSWNDYHSMCWYPGMTVRGAFKASFGHNSRTIESMGQFAIIFDNNKFMSFSDFDGYRDSHKSNYQVAPWDDQHYDWALHPPPSRHGFDHDHHFIPWHTGDNSNGTGDSNHGDNHPGNGQSGSIATPVVTMNPPHPIQRPATGGDNTSHPVTAPPTSGTTPIGLGVPVNRTPTGTSGAATHTFKRAGTLGAKSTKTGTTTVSRGTKSLITATPSPTPTPTPAATPAPK